MFASLVSAGKGTALPLCTIVVVVLVLVLPMRAEAHVIGIDFGSEYIKVAGPHGDQSVDIVLNELSKRKTDNFLGFRNNERYVGDQAKNLAARFPLLTVSAINQLMGLRSGSPEAQTFAEMKYEYDIQFDARGTVRVPVKDPNGPFTAEELYAMFLSYSAQISELDGVVLPESAVITIPFSASIAERRAILEAARLAKMDVLGFLHSTTAAAMYYGIRRRGFGDRNVTMVVFDVGTSHTEAGVYRFSPAEVKKGGPLGDAFGTLTTVTVIEDRSLGGRAFDLCVANIIEADAIEKMKVKPVLEGSSPAQLKSRFSLLRAANKVREILSANSKTPLSVEGIAPDRDFHSELTRETFEAQCAPLFARVKQLAQSVLDATGLKASQIDAFEMMGGAARMPKIISDVSAVLGREVDRTLNMDEAAVIGAAYYGVKLSPFYRVKSFKLREQAPFTVAFSVDPPLAGEKKHTSPPHLRQLFSSSDQIGQSMSISLNRTEDFALRLHSIREDAQAPHFAEVRVHGVGEALEKLSFVNPAVQHPNNTHFVRIQLKLNESGLVEVEDAEVFVRVAVNTSTLVEYNETDDKGEVKVALKTEYAVKMRQRSRKLKTSMSWFNPRERTSAEWLASETKLFDMAEREALKRERAEAKNNLEGYMFWVKGDGIFYNDDAVAKIDPTVLDSLRVAVSNVEAWLEDGRGSSDACTRSEYEEQHAALKKAVKAATGEPDEEKSTGAPSGLEDLSPLPNEDAEKDASPMGGEDGERDPALDVSSSAEHDDHYDEDL